MNYMYLCLCFYLNCSILGQINISNTTGFVSFEKDQPLKVGFFITIFIYDDVLMMYDVLSYCILYPLTISMFSPDLPLVPPDSQCLDPPVYLGL